MNLGLTYFQMHCYLLSQNLLAIRYPGLDWIHLLGGWQILLE